MEVWQSVPPTPTLILASPVDTHVPCLSVTASVQHPAQHPRVFIWDQEVGMLDLTPGRLLRPFLLGYRQESPFTHMEPLPRPHPSHIAAIAGLLSLIPDLHQVEPILLPHKAFPPHCAPCLSLTLFLSCFETRSHSLAQAGLRLIIIFLPRPSKP